jgi:basic membrane protein A
MKKAVIMLLVVGLLAGVRGFTPVRAAEAVVVQITVGSKKAYINSKVVALDQPPIIENGRTLVPFRFIGEAIGATIGWNPVKKTVSYVLGDKNIVLTIGSITAMVNGVKTTLDVAPKILPTGRTVVPVRFISESIGAKVDWNATTRMVTVTVAATPVIKKIKVALILSGVRNDGSWNQAQYEGMVNMQKQLTYVEVTVSENVAQDAAEKVIRDYANLGYNAIFTCEYAYMDPTLNVAKDFPNIIFENCSGYKSAANMGNYFGRIYQADYLSGLLVGKMTKSNYIGVVAPFSIPQIVGEIDAFTIGVRQVNPKAEVHVVWLNSWFDPVNEALATDALLASGADVIESLVGDSAAITEAAKAGKYSVGYYYDKSSVAPASVLTSRVFHWEVYFVECLKAIHDGTWTPKPYWGQMSTGVVGLAPYGSMVPQEVRVFVDKKKQEIVAGTYDPFDGPIYDQQGILKVKQGEQLSDADKQGIQWFVQGVIGTIPQSGG